MTRSATVAELAALVGGRVERGDEARTIRRIMPVDSAHEDAITFVTKPKYLPLLETTRAGAVMIAPELLSERDVRIAAGTAVISTPRPYVAFARAAQHLAHAIPGPVIGVHSSAAIDSTACLGRDVAIGPFVWVGPGASVGEGSVLHAGVHVEAGASVGAGSVLYNHVVVRHGCSVGARCVLHPGVVIGGDGFGFAAETTDGEGLLHVKIPQTGDVVIEDDVEIGANSCVDRAALGTTRIGAGTKIDNLVQIGHNVQIGPACIIVAQAGVAGSSTLGRAVTMGAQSGVSGHVEIGEGALIYGQAGVMSEVPAGQKVAGTPAVPSAEFFKTVVRVSKLDELASRLKKLEKLVGSTKKDIG